MARQYTDAQLKEMARPFESHALDALAAGDIPRVRALMREMAQGPAGLDALSGHTLARKVGKLRQDFGEERTREALRRIGRQLMRTWARDLQAGDEKGAITAVIEVYKHQVGAQLKPSETDDEVVVDLLPCGSGGRLERQGVTAKHPRWYAGWSDGVPSYCQLCKAYQDGLNEQVGYPAWTTEKGPDGTCRMRFRKQQPGTRLFEPGELDEAARTRLQRAEAALEAGDLEQVAALLDGQRKDWMPWHDFGIVCLEYFYNVALELGGPDYLDELLAQTYEPAFVAGFPRYDAMSDDELVREIARTWNYHCADFTIQEEDDRFVFVLDPCGSGGRLLRGQVWRDMFHYGEPLSQKMPQPHPINFQRHDAPTYCTHCAASNRAQFKGGPLFFVIDGHAQMQPGQPCRQFSYKKAAARRCDPALPAQVGLSPTPSPEGTS
jgi:hypothetical protein